MAIEGYAWMEVYKPEIIPEMFVYDMISEPYHEYSTLDRLFRWREYSSPRLWQWEGGDERYNPQLIKSLTEQYFSLITLDLIKLQRLKVVAGGLLNTSPLNLPNLTNLRVAHCPRLDTFKIGAPFLKRLEVLDNGSLASIQVRIPYSARVVVRTPLPKFDIERIPLEDSDLELIKDPIVKSIDFFDLSYCDKITDVGLAPLTNLRPKKLSLRGCKKLTTQGIAHLIGSLGGLRAVDLGELPKLRLLTIDQHLLKDYSFLFDYHGWCHINHGGFTVQEWRSGIHLTMVHSIDLSDNAELLDNDCFISVKLESSTVQADMRGEKISLSISNCCKLTDRFFKRLFPLTSLRELRANNLPLLTDEGLKGLVRIQKFSIAKCKQITDAGLKALEAIKTLQILNVKGCPLVTLNGVRSLERAIPGIQILHDLD